MFSVGLLKMIAEPSPHRKVILQSMFNCANAIIPTLQVVHVKILLILHFGLLR